VPEFLSDAWFEALGAAAEGSTVAAELDLVIQQVIPDGRDGGEVAYAVTAAGGALTVRRGRVDAPDITFTQDRATAEAIHRGELSAQTAFIDGRLRLGGDLRAVIDRAGSLVAVDDLFAATRA
jgi:hypothetical protein